MSLKCGFVGIAGSGKTTLFNCMLGTKAHVSSGVPKTNIGMVNVPDNRLKTLEKFQKTERLVPAVVEVVDIPGLAKGSTQNDSMGARFLADIRQTDAIIHIIRCFEDPNLPHIETTIDPVRDKEIVDLELQFRDLESVEKKILKYEKLVKIGDKDAKKGLEVLTAVKRHLEEFKPVRTAPIEKENRKYMQDLFLLTEKPVLYVCNVDADSAVAGNPFSTALSESLANENASVLVIAAGLEAEIAELENEDDRKEFLDDYGLHEPGVNKLIRACYELLRLNTFFTVGPKEIRAWTIQQGMTAPQAAGVIHSDLEKGFIRAEVMKYNDFTTLGSEHACRDAGKLMIEGKNYIVHDGDILHIRFNV